MPKTGLNCKQDENTNLAAATAIKCNGATDEVFVGRTVYHITKTMRCQLVTDARPSSGRRKYTSSTDEQA